MFTSAIQMEWAALFIFLPSTTWFEKKIKWKGLRHITKRSQKISGRESTSSDKPMSTKQLSACVQSDRCDLFKNTERTIKYSFSSLNIKKMNGGLPVIWPMNHEEPYRTVVKRVIAKKFSRKYIWSSPNPIMMQELWTGPHFFTILCLLHLINNKYM